MRFQAMLLLAALIFVSGCIGSAGVKTSQNNGLVVNDFSAEPAAAEFNENVRFFLDVENQGGTTASCVTSSLFGVDGWRDALSGQPLSSAILIPPQKGLAINFFEGNLNICYFDSAKGQQICVGYVKGGGVSLSAFIGDSFTAFQNQFCNTAAVYANQIDPSTRLLKFQPLLRPPLPERNKAGESWTAEWVLKPPQVPEGLTVPYTVTSRTEYFYTSNGQVNVRAFNKDEFKRRQITGDPSIAAAPLAIENVHGAPIQIVAVRGDNPMIINQDTFAGTAPLDYFSYTFELQNVGGGLPLPITSKDIAGAIGPDAESGFVFATITVNGPGAFFSNCLGQSGQEIFVSGGVVRDLLKIRSDKRAPFGCQIAIDKTKWIDTPVGTVTVTFHVFYRYFIDREVVVNVVGPERI